MDVLRYLLLDAAVPITESFARMSTLILQYPSRSYYSVPADRESAHNIQLIEQYRDELRRQQRLLKVDILSPRDEDIALTPNLSVQIHHTLSSLILPMWGEKDDSYFLQLHYNVSLDDALVKSLTNQYVNITLTKAQLNEPLSLSADLSKFDTPFDIGPHKLGITVVLCYMESTTQVHFFQQQAISYFYYLPEDTKLHVKLADGTLQEISDAETPPAASTQSRYNYQPPTTPQNNNGQTQAQVQAPAQQQTTVAEQETGAVLLNPENAIIMTAPLNNSVVSTNFSISVALPFKVLSSRSLRLVLEVDKDVFDATTQLRQAHSSMSVAWSDGLLSDLVMTAADWNESFTFAFGVSIAKPGVHVLRLHATQLIGTKSSSNASQEKQDEVKASSAIVEEVTFVASTQPITCVVKT